MKTELLQFYYSPLNHKIMKIGIIGSGKIGGTIGTHWAQAGHEVFFSSRHPETLRDLAKQAGSNAQYGSIEAAAAFGEVLLISIPFGKIGELRQKIGSQAGKVIIETNNYYPVRDGLGPGVEMQASGQRESEWTASYFPEASVAKAFNTISFRVFQTQAFAQPQRVAVPYAAQDERAKTMTQDLIESIGFDTVYVGTLSETAVMQPDGVVYVKAIGKESLQKLIDAAIAEVHQ